MTSILTNAGALVALQTLRATNRSLDTTQNHISTGKRINTAADGSAVWAVAKVMESDRDSFKIIQQGMDVGGKIVSIAVENAHKVTSKLKEIQNLLLAAINEHSDGEKSLNEIKEIIVNIGLTISSAQFNGVNLLSNKGAGGADKETYTLLASLDRNYGEAVSKVSVIDVPSVNLEGKVWEELRDLLGLGSISSTKETTDLEAGAVSSKGNGTRNTEAEFYQFAHHSWMYRLKLHDVTSGVTGSSPHVDAPADAQVAVEDYYNHLINDNRDVDAAEKIALEPKYQAVKAALDTYNGNRNSTTLGAIWTASKAFEAEVKNATGWSASEGNDFKNHYNNWNNQPPPPPEEKTAYFILRTGGTISEPASVTPHPASTTAPTFPQMLAKVQELLDISIDAGALLGAKQQRIESQSETIRKLSDSLDMGISTLVDTNLEEASARLKALQTQQQLGVQALSIANNNPQSVLSLFR